MKKKVIKVSLPTYISLHSIASLLLACIISFSIVCTGMSFFYHGQYTHSVVLILCLIACILTLVIGAIFIRLILRHFVRSILMVSEGVQKVATGDFSVQIAARKNQEGRIVFRNEIDELSENFNRMAEELNGMDYMRKDFMSSVSHEIKTPIASITGFTEILLDGGLTQEEQQEYLEFVYQETMRLSRLSENMLHMSRLDYQEIVKKEDRVRLDEQLRKAVILVQERWSTNLNEFDLSLEKVFLQTNADMLFQVWINLIDNAIKYSPERSSVHIQMELLEDTIQVIIRDEGCGIEEEKLERIYERFYQCDESHKKQGNGLGLPIVRRILELLGGTIQCSSVLGSGTTMTVTLPRISEE